MFIKHLSKAFPIAVVITYCNVILAWAEILALL